MTTQKLNIYIYHPHRNTAEVQIAGVNIILIKGNK